MGSSRTRAAWPRTLGVCVGLLIALAPLASAQEGDGLPGGPRRTAYGASLEERAGPTPSGDATPPAPAEVDQTYAPGVVIHGTPAFVQQTTAQLDALRRTAAGREILAAIGASGHTTTITGTDAANGYARAADVSAANLAADGTPGAGSDATIQWNPNYSPGNLPSAVILAHELIHTMHYALGVRDPTRITDTSDPDFDMKIEELRTAGIPPYDQDNPLTENAVRAQWNALFGTSLPVRQSYAPSAWSPSGLFTPGEHAAEQQRLQQQQQQPRPQRPTTPAAQSAPRKGAAGVLNDMFGGGR